MDFTVWDRLHYIIIKERFNNSKACSLSPVLSLAYFSNFVGKTEPTFINRTIFSGKLTFQFHQPCRWWWLLVVEFPGRLIPSNGSQSIFRLPHPILRLSIHPHSYVHFDNIIFIISHFILYDCVVFVFICHEQDIEIPLRISMRREAHPPNLLLL